MKIACFGDSLTVGMAGYTYIKFMSEDNKILNHGVNGDTAYCCFERLGSFLANPRHNDVDCYVIEVGTNDTLMPYLGTVDPVFGAMMKPRMKLKHCLTDDMEFEKQYEKCLDLLAGYKKPAVVIGMPYLELIDFPQEEISARNAIIKRLADKHKMPFIDPSALQLKISANPAAYSWKYKSLWFIITAILMTVLPFFKELYPKTRRLKVTVDGAHLKKEAAKAVGEAVDEALFKINKAE